MNTQNGSFEHIKLEAKWIFHDESDIAILPFKPSIFQYEYQTLPFSMLATEDKIKEHSIGIGKEIAIADYSQKERERNETSQ